ncbi:hypothetical protein EDEG_01380 [Edhazardia aedis USNM 41457]|uniref:Uncharacterized protein n=1 Tax=Edhazardia aedis (strain USNM 41457) TaxID=1003232 RepID=J9DA37_EDHAE|nr:hypothetical protein EDEG_01380 [Edhazardia aedis USNM 41457]|eukprot:EJW04379.1 hypothetical protein EDEG_01380 [Edhazardia aedis USNM 41457]
MKSATIIGMHIKNKTMLLFLAKMYAVTYHIKLANTDRYLIYSSDRVPKLGDKGTADEFEIINLDEPRNKMFKSTKMGSLVLGYEVDSRKVEYTEEVQSSNTTMEMIVYNYDKSEFMIACNQRCLEWCQGCLYFMFNKCNRNNKNMIFNITNTFVPPPPPPPAKPVCKDNKPKPIPYTPPPKVTYNPVSFVNPSPPSYSIVSSPRCMPCESPAPNICYSCSSCSPPPCPCSANRSYGGFY